jgi:plastocyanin
MKNIIGSGLWLFLLAFILTACTGQTPSTPQVNAPAISVEITKDNCPSIEAQADIQILWTNTDTVDLVLLIEHKDENGTITETGGTDLFQPGTTFSISSLSPGEYTYFCSQDHSAFGMITIIP